MQRFDHVIDQSLDTVTSILEESTYSAYDRETELRTKQLQIENLSNEVNVKTQKLNENDYKLHDLKSNMQIAKRNFISETAIANTQLDQAIQSELNRLRMLDQSLMMSKNKIHQISSSCNDMQKEIYAIEQNINQCDSKSSYLQSSLLVTNNSFNDTSSMIKNEFENYNRQSLQINEDLQVTHTRISNNISQSQAIKQEIASLQNHQTYLYNQIKSAQNSLRLSRDQSISNQSIIQNESNSHNRSKILFESQKNHYMAHVNDLGDRITHVEVDLFNVEQKKKALYDEMTQKQKDILKTRESVSEQRKLASNISNENTKREETVEKTLKGFKNKSFMIQSKIFNNKTHIQSIKSQEDEIKDKLRDICSKITRQNEIEDQLNEISKQIDQDFFNMNSKITRYESVRDSMINELDDIEKRIESANSSTDSIDLNITPTILNISDISDDQSVVRTSTLHVLVKEVLTQNKCLRKQVHLLERHLADLNGRMQVINSQKDDANTSNDLFKYVAIVRGDIQSKLSEISAKTARIIRKKRILSSKKRMLKAKNGSQTNVDSSISAMFNNELLKWLSVEPGNRTNLICQWSDKLRNLIHNLETDQLQNVFYL